LLHISVPVLKLSVMWGFRAITKLAISQIFRRDTVDPLTKVLIARDCGLSAQLLSSLSLYTRQRMVKEEDADALGLDYFLKILEVQERAILMPENKRSRYDSTEPVPPNRQNYDFTETLMSIFQEELKRFYVDIGSGPERVPSPVAPVQVGGPEKDDRFFPVDVFFLVRWH
jgi:hypothetical protein